MGRARRAIISADDFGLSEAVNEAVERAHRNGILSTASLMVAGPAAADAVRRARANPRLRVGLHLVVVEGPAVLPPSDIPGLVDAQGRFPSDQFRLGLRYFFRPEIRRQLAAEIRAQFRAFAATRLRLDHANAHKHMHLHPTVGRLLIETGRAHGLRALRIPAEPPRVLRASGQGAGPGGAALYRWSTLLRRQARRAGLRVNDHAFGIAWSGGMDAARLAWLARHLPEGLSEIYLHPATHQDEAMAALMPGYRHAAEFAALLDPAVRGSFAAAGVKLVTWRDIDVPKPGAT